MAIRLHQPHKREWEAMIKDRRRMARGQEHSTSDT